MPLNDVAYVLPAHGTAYLAPVGTATPTVYDPPVSPFVELAHIGTADGDGLPNWTSDGGDVSTLGSWQKAAIRTYTEPITEAIEFELSQVDTETLKLYTGSTGGTTPGQFQVLGSDIGTGITSALLIIIKDGALRLGFYAPKVSITRNDDISVDPEKALRLPVKATLLDVDAVTPRYTWLGAWFSGTGS